LPEDELRQVFYYCLIECAVHGERYLYDDVFVTRIARQYRDQLAKPEFDPANYPIHQIGKWRVLVNETPQNLTNLVFKRGVADIYVFCHDGFAGVVFDQRGSDVLDHFSLGRLYFELLKARPNEHWVYVGKNLIMCGGKKHPHRKTSISSKELLELIEKAKK
jgi:hypothetical protein